MPQEQHPEMTLVCGSNGAGKSTLTQDAIAKSLDKHLFLDPDRIARDRNLSPVEAGKTIAAIVKENIAQKHSFIRESTLTAKFDLQMIQAAKENGFKISLIYIGVGSADNAVQRVRERHAKGGHSVPEEDIRRRYARSLNNLPEAIRLVDSARILDNSGERYRDVAVFEHSRLVAQETIPEWFKPVCEALGLNIIAMPDIDEWQSPLQMMTFPTCAFRPGQTEKFVGTSFACAYKGHYFILNSGHTVADINNDLLHEMAILLPTVEEKKFSYNDKYDFRSCCTKFIQEGKFDIAITYISPEGVDIWRKKGCKFFDLEYSFKEYNSRTQEITHIIFFGFPTSGFAPNATRAHFKFIYYFTLVIPPSQYPKRLRDKIDSVYHILGDYRRDVLRKNEHGDTSQVTLPSLRGLSGGPVFGYNPLIPKLYFVGIGDAQYERDGVVAAFRVERIIQALDAFLQECNPLPQQNSR